MKGSAVIILLNKDPISLYYSNLSSQGRQIKPDLPYKCAICFCTLLVSSSYIYTAAYSAAEMPQACREYVNLDSRVYTTEGISVLALHLLGPAPEAV